jgi:hypothetical protein
MKKALLLLVAAIAVAGLMPAATINCLPANQNVITGNVVLSGVTVACDAITATSGSVITSLAIQFMGNWQDSNPNNGTHQVRFDLSGQGAYSGMTATGTPAAGDTGTTGFLTGASIAIANLTSIPSLTLNASGTSLAGGIPDNASVTVFLITTESSTVPEPATIAFMGGGLLALGVFARRRKKA